MYLFNAHTLLLSIWFAPLHHSYCIYIATRTWICLAHLCKNHFLNLCTTEVYIDMNDIKAHGQKCDKYTDTCIYSSDSTIIILTCLWVFQHSVQISIGSFYLTFCHVNKDCLLHRHSTIVKQHVFVTFIIQCEHNTVTLAL